MVTIVVDMNMHVCVQCGKRGKGFYEVKDQPDKYICHKCVMANILRRSKSRKEKN